MRYLLDTDVCVELLRRRQPGLAARFARLPAGAAGLSVVTVLELTFGALKSARPEQNLTAVRALAGGLPVLALEAAMADAYGRVRLELEKAGARAHRRKRPPDRGTGTSPGSDIGDKQRARVLPRPGAARGELAPRTALTFK